MPAFTLPSQCYMLPSGFWVLGEYARGEPIGQPATPFRPFSDDDFITLLDAYGPDATGPCSIVITSGKCLVVSPSIEDTAQTPLDLFASAVSGLGVSPNFTGAVWSAGSPVSTVTMTAPAVFTENEREQLEIAVQKAMQYMGMYYDIESVVRENPVMTVTLDESQKPYDAGWDSVWAETAAMFGGELP